MADPKSLYNNDTAAWAEQQAAALRAAARGDSNQFVNWENLAEEIESLGKSLKYALASQIFHVIHHLEARIFASGRPSQGLAALHSTSPDRRSAVSSTTVRACGARLRL
ncbi:MAG: DUF29 family protein [Alphaproteobacteria bacterium]|nr:DUF29 family protein [Alphaproteobacteria bacterium]